MLLFSGARIDKRFEKNIQNKIWAEMTYMCIWPRAMTKTIVKINKTTTILNNFSICCEFYFSVLLKNGKIGPIGLKASCLAKKNKNSICPKGQAK